MSLDVVVLIAVFVFGLPRLLMWVWNLTMPELFHWSRLRYWQAFRLLIIVEILFGALSWHYTL